MKNMIKFLLVMILVFTSGCFDSINEDDFLFTPRFWLTQENMSLRIKLQNKSEEKLDDLTVKFYLIHKNSKEKILVQQYDDVDFRSTELKYFEFDITSFKDEYHISNEQVLNNEYSIDFEISVKK